MSLASKCTCGSNAYYCDGMTENCHNRLNTSMQNITIDKEAFNMIYVLSTLLDFASEARDSTIVLGISEAEKIIKILKSK